MRHPALSLLARLVDPQIARIHAARRKALWRTVGSLLSAGQLWLTALGRSLPSRASAKHRIKMVDRLLGNAHLHAEMTAIYAALAAVSVRGLSQPFVLVDWTEHRQFAVLSASLLQQTRALPLYNEAHPRSRLGNRAVQKRFLEALDEVLPDGCRPIIVTDAGFQGPWFDDVAARGWFYVGRVRNRTKFEQDGTWRPVKSLYENATTRARNVGRVRLRRENPRERRLVVFRKKLKGRINKNKRGKRSRTTEAKKSARRSQEPWVLVVSPDMTASARDIAKIYAARFQIEQSFRDQKSHRVGWALRLAMPRKASRLAVLFLIATMARLACELVGLAAERCGLHRHHQANTVVSRRVLSLFNLGRRVIAEWSPQLLSLTDLQRSILEIRVRAQELPASGL